MKYGWAGEKPIILPIEAYRLHQREDAKKHVCSTKDLQNLSTVHDQHTSHSLPHPTVKSILHQLIHLLLQHNPETKRLERYAITKEMLAHRLDPVQSQRMQHSTCSLHDDQNGHREDKPHDEEEEDGEDSKTSGEAESVGECHGPEHVGELLVSEGKGPQSEIRGGVGDAVQAEF